MVPILNNNVASSGYDPQAFALDDTARPNSDKRLVGFDRNPESTSIITIRHEDLLEMINSTAVLLRYRHLRRARLVIFAPTILVNCKLARRRCTPWCTACARSRAFCSRKVEAAKG